MCGYWYSFYKVKTIVDRRAFRLLCLLIRITITWERSLVRDSTLSGHLHPQIIDEAVSPSLSRNDICANLLKWSIVRVFLKRRFSVLVIILCQVKLTAFSRLIRMRRVISVQKFIRLPWLIHLLEFLDSVTLCLSLPLKLLFLVKITLGRLKV